MAAAVGALRGGHTGCPALASLGNGRRGPAVAAILLPLALLAAQGESTLPGTEAPIWLFHGLRHGAWR